MKQSALRSIFIFRGRVIGLDNYKSKDFMSRVVDTHYLKEFHKNSLVMLQNYLEIGLEI